MTAMSKHTEPGSRKSSDASSFDETSFGNVDLEEMTKPEKPKTKDGGDEDEDQSCKLRIRAYPRKNSK